MSGQGHLNKKVCCFFFKISSKFLLMKYVEQKFIKTFQVIGTNLKSSKHS